MTELVVANPATGEVISLEATTDVLAATVDDLKDWQRRIQSVIDAVSEELVARLDQENVRSAPVGDWEIKTVAPTRTDFDPERLSAALAGLVETGAISGDVARRTVKCPPLKDWKVDRRELGKLLNHSNPVVVEAVRACGESVPQRRYVTVRRAA